MKKFSLPNALSLLKYDAVCMRHILLAYMESNKHVPDEPTQGDAVGNQTYLLQMIFLDIASITYEGLSLFANHTAVFDELISETPPEFYERIGRLNDGLKVWDATKRAPIIARRKEKYLFSKKNVSLCFLLEDNAKTLLGIDLFFEHYIESAGIEKSDIMSFSEHCAKFISIFAELDIVPTSLVEDNVLVQKPFILELFDWSFDEARRKSNLSSETFYSILICLSRLSYIEILLSKFIDDNELAKSLDWLFFLLRWMSVYYVEVRRSFRGIAENTTDDEYQIIDKLFERCFAHEHHTDNEILASSICKVASYTQMVGGSNSGDSISIYKMYSEHTGIKSWKAFENSYKNLRNEISIWTNALRDLVVNGSV